MWKKKTRLEQEKSFAETTVAKDLSTFACSDFHVNYNAGHQHECRQLYVASMTGKHGPSAMSPFVSE